MGIVERAALDDIAHRMLDHPWWVIFLSAVLAGWMMGLLSWLVTAGRDTISQVFFVWLVTTAIGFAGLHHSIVGSGEVLVAVFAGTGPGWGEFARFLVFATLGNALGGTFFVGLIKYAHASAGQRSRPDPRTGAPARTRPWRRDPSDSGR
jgi:formate/nitrite transporter FocA (FNT family)